MPKSIRWRLPLSYAAIALLATLSLGAVLLTMLREYYLQRELDYLNSNAETASLLVAQLVEANAPQTALEAQLTSLAFLSQTRVRLLDAQEQPIADSGNPQSPREVVSLSVADEMPAFALLTQEKAGGGIQPSTSPLTLTRIITKAVEDQEQPYSAFISIKEIELEMTELVNGPGELDILTVINSDDPSQGGPSFVSRIHTFGTPYGFDLSAGSTADDSRSDQQVRRSIYSQSGGLLGYVELLDGPAYGRQILERVIQGGIIAGVVAVLLAAFTGWWASRRITTPLLALTGVTTRMAAGDLSARAAVGREDELGTLSHSFNEMAGQVEGTVGALRRFVADAAHELHTPLTALRTNLELIADEQGNDRRRNFVARAQTQAERLESLTRSLLDLSQLESGTAQEAAPPVELTALVRETSEVYASRAEQAGLTFSLDLPGESVTVQGGQGQLGQALGNLLDNALKFTPEGGEVSVGLRQERMWVRLWVQDTGIGVPADDLPGLFNRFHRGRNAIIYPGSGLGLAIVKAVVDGHGGQVSVESTGQGTRFVLRLPVAN